MQLLLLSHDTAIIETVRSVTLAAGDTLDIAGTVAEAKTRIRSGDHDSVLLDCALRATELIAFAGEVKHLLVETVVLLIGPLDQDQREHLSQRISAHYDIDKPLREAALADIMHRVRMRSIIVRTAGLIGHSPAMEEAVQTIMQIGPTPISVLVTGESGSGKEVVARAIHAVSPRAAKPFLAVNCASLAEGVLESELFGHEKGSFTGAHARRQGMFENAAGGTIFLDEIGEIAPSTQVRLLRVLEEREIIRVGGTEVIPVDVRVIAATNRNLAELVQKGAFRRDLYYRIKVLELKVPPLRERPEDIPLLVDRIARAYARDNGLPQRRFDDTAREYLARLSWSGNVRELRNFVESAIALTTPQVIRLDDIPRHLIGEVSSLPTLPVPSVFASDAFERELLYRTLLELKRDIADIKDILLAGRNGYDTGMPPRDMEVAPIIAQPETLADRERDAIADALARTGGNRRKASELLGIGERTLYRKITEYGLRE